MQIISMPLRYHVINVILWVHIQTYPCFQKKLSLIMDFSNRPLKMFLGLKETAINHSYLFNTEQIQ